MLPILTLRATLSVLSRLKGIETRSGDAVAVHQYCPLDMLSRLKGIETYFVDSKESTRYTLDMLSRLKGIETLLSPARQFPGLQYLCLCFPV